MTFKTPEVEAEFDSVSTFLHLMAKDFETASKLFAGQDIVITRVKEHICGDSGVHEAHRAFDVRDEFDGKRLFTDDQVKSLVDHINTLYPRNDGKPTCIHHSFNCGPFHFHIQLALLTTAYEAVKSGEQNSGN